MINHTLLWVECPLFAINPTWLHVDLTSQRLHQTNQLGCISPLWSRVWIPLRPKLTCGFGFQSLPDCVGFPWFYFEIDTIINLSQLSFDDQIFIIMTSPFFWFGFQSPGFPKSKLILWNNKSLQRDPESSCTVRLLGILHPLCPGVVSGTYPYPLSPDKRMGILLSRMFVLRIKGCISVPPLMLLVHRGVK